MEMRCDKVRMSRLGRAEGCKGGNLAAMGSTRWVTFACWVLGPARPSTHSSQFPVDPPGAAERSVHAHPRQARPPPQDTSASLCMC